MPASPRRRARPRRVRARGRRWGETRTRGPGSPDRAFERARRALLLRRRDNSLYRGLREGLDHFGFKVESLEKTKLDLNALFASAPQPPSGKFVGGNGKKNEEDFHRCCLGKHFIADPDGVLIDFSE